MSSFLECRRHSRDNMHQTRQVWRTVHCQAPSGSHFLLLSSSYPHQLRESSQHVGDPHSWDRGGRPPADCCLLKARDSFLELEPRLLLDTVHSPWGLKELDGSFQGLCITLMSVLSLQDWWPSPWVLSRAEASHFASQ